MLSRSKFSTSFNSALLDFLEQLPHIVSPLNAELVKPAAHKAASETGIVL